jgi:hypothetical protein
MFSNNYISTIVDYQLPDFIRADHPTFVALLKKYYEYMETNGKTLYENKRLYEYFDVDTTRQDLVKYFKSKIIPNFPEESELSTEKLVKAARDFYTKKGTPDSFKFLFRVLYGQEIEVYFPKQDILRASDGKWQLPQALRLAISDTLTIIPSGNVNVTISAANTVSCNGINLINTLITANSLIRVGNEKRKVLSVNTLGDYLTVTIPFASTANNASNTQIYNSARLYIVTPSAYENFNFNLIERRQGYGSESRATCIIETAVKSVDKETGREIAEVYISNLRKPLTVNENLVVEYVDENGLNKTFSSKIISLISNISLKRNRLGVVQSGSRYKTGDPVVFYGGLNAESPEASKAVATVQNVSVGAIKTVLLSNRGYYFRPHANSLVQILSEGGSGANVVIGGIFQDGVNLVANAVSNLVYNYSVTNSGTSAYVINGANNPTLYLYRGLDYKFDVSAVGHPFWIQTAAGAYSAGSVYNEGVVNNGVSNGSITFSVPMNAPDTLYYICQNHSVMGGTITTLSLPSSGTSNSDTFTFGTDAIYRKHIVSLNDPDGYGFENVSTYINLTSGAGNTVTTVNLNTPVYLANTTNDYYKSFVLKIIDGTGAAASPNSAVIQQYYGANQIAVLDSALGAVPDGTSRFRLYANANTELGRAFSFETFTMGKIRLLNLIKKGGGFESSPTFEVDSVYDTDFSTDSGTLKIPAGEFSNYNKANFSIELRASNTSFNIANGYYTGARLFVDTGINQHYADIVDYVVTDISLPSMTKRLFLSRPFEESVTSTNIQNYRLFIDFRANVKDNGRIGVVEILNGGSGYHPTDKLQFVGTGYGAKAAITVVAGKISDISLISRGEGYYSPPSCVVLNSSGTASNGSGAVFRVTGLSDGEELSAEVTALGAVEDFNLINRGYDYIQAPEVSLKVADIYSDNLFSTIAIAPIVTGDKVWQGNELSNDDATFSAIVDEVYRISSNSNAGIIRIFDYSGSIVNNIPLRVNTASLNVSVNVVTQNASISFNDVNPATLRQYPYFYGDGLAKANAEFLNGLIKYNGFYLNTDGHLSSDKKIQDGKYYHNFSYEIQSEKSLNDYQETVERVAHPAGMQLWSKYLIRDQIDETITTSSNVHISNTAQTTNCNTAYTSVFVTGNNSNFINTANVGDLIVINSDDSAILRTYVKVITSVDVAQDRVAIESPIGGLSDGYIRTTVGNATAIIYGNSYPVHFSLKSGDSIGLPIGANNTIVNKTVSTVSNTSNVIVFNNPNSLTTTNTQYQYNRDYRRVPYKIIKFNG